MRNSYVFLLGLLSGLSVTLMLHVYNSIDTYYSVKITSLFSNVGIPMAYKVTHVTDRISENKSQILIQEDDTLAKELYNKVRVACWILTSPSNLDTKAIYVKNTWSKKCHLVLFMSSVQNNVFPTVGLNTSEGRQHLTAKSMQAFQYLYENHLDDADWFMKADDDTYVIMENLRYFLSNEKPEEPVYFGQKFKQEVKQGYASGGAGYVLSKESLRRFGRRDRNNTTFCKADSGFEDMEVGRCLESLGVKLKPTFDRLNRHRFHFTNPESYLRPNFPQSTKTSIDPEGGRGGIENMSNYAISFHYVSGVKMYDLEFYIYHLRPYGILNVPMELNVKAEGQLKKNLSSVVQ